MDVQVLLFSLSNERKSFVDIDINVIGTVDAESEEDDIEVGNNEEDGSNDEDEYLGKYAPPQGKVYLSHEWKTYIRSVGQKFEGGVTEFRDKLCKYAIEKGFRFAYIKNDKERVTAECFMKHAEGCSWRIHAILNRANGFFYIKDLNNEHSCRARIRLRKSVLMGSKIVSSVVADQIRSKPLMKPIEIVKDFKHNYGLDISYYNAWKGKELAKIQVHGDEESSYTQLLWYVDALMKTNKGSHCVLECDEISSRFKRLFISYHASIEGIYPLAFAIVDSEDENNWTWFLENIYQILRPQGRKITFISDRNKGLLEAVQKVFPDSDHAFCLFHLKQNVLKRYPSRMGKSYRNWIVKCFKRCAYGGGIMQKFLEDTPKEHWSNAFFPGNKYGEMCSNLAESFNAWVKVERELPSPQLVNRLRVKLMVSYAARRRAATKWSTILCPKMEKLLNKLYEVGRHWDVSRSTDFIFEVHDTYSFLVDLETRTCSCHQWQIKGFPCAHAIAATVADEGDPYTYVEPYFTVDFYKNCYSNPIVPVSDIEKKTPDEYGNLVVKPPLTRKPPGRPRKRRIPSAGEEVRSIKCGRCGVIGRHNRKTCTSAI
ncbi:uncharacterized protein LOC112203983 [Rosa chinensis]|uniref:uncharacterized protein LOC112203983 n=1 Tax=Rosa chinensis TaxID=74649 RepID=UPI000D0934DF|nr:uncharacterized protein LOC112203983 [Rosa chinensis]